MVQGNWSFESGLTHVLASWIDMSSNNSPTVAMSSGFQSPFGAETPVKIKNGHWKIPLEEMFCWTYEFFFLRQRMLDWQRHK